MLSTDIQLINTPSVSILSVQNLPASFMIFPSFFSLHTLLSFLSTLFNPSFSFYTFQSFLFFLRFPFLPFLFSVPILQAPVSPRNSFMMINMNGKVLGTFMKLLKPLSVYIFRYLFLFFSTIRSFSFSSNLYLFFYFLNSPSIGYRVVQSVEVLY